MGIEPNSIPRLAVDRVFADRIATPSMPREVGSPVPTRTASRVPVSGRMAHRAADPVRERAPPADPSSSQLTTISDVEDQNRPLTQDPPSLSASGTRVTRHCDQTVVRNSPRGSRAGFAALRVCFLNSIVRGSLIFAPVRNSAVKVDDILQEGGFRVSVGRRLNRGEAQSTAAKPAVALNSAISASRAGSDWCNPAQNPCDRRRSKSSSATPCCSTQV